MSKITNENLIHEIRRKQISRPKRMFEFAKKIYDGKDDIVNARVEK